MPSTHAQPQFQTRAVHRLMHAVRGTWAICRKRELEKATSEELGASPADCQDARKPGGSLRHRIHSPTPARPMPAPLMRQAGIRLACQEKRSQNFPPFLLSEAFWTRDRPSKAHSAPVTAYQRPIQSPPASVARCCKEGRATGPAASDFPAELDSSIELASRISHRQPQPAAPLPVCSPRPLDCHRHLSRRHPADPTRTVSQPPETLAAQASPTT